MLAGESDEGGSDEGVLEGGTCEGVADEGEGVADEGDGVGSGEFRSTISICACALEQRSMRAQMNDARISATGYHSSGAALRAAPRYSSFVGPARQHSYADYLALMV